LCICHQEERTEESENVGEVVKNSLKEREGEDMSEVEDEVSDTSHERASILATTSS
jgi:hypothetical protein